MRVLTQVCLLAAVAGLACADFEGLVESGPAQLPGHPAASVAGTSVSSAWAKTYSGPAQDEGAYAVRQTADGGFIVGGWTASFGVGGGDWWLVRLDPSGTPLWQKTYGGPGGGFGGENVEDLEITSDGGYVVAGATNSFGAEHHQPLVLRLDGSGNVLWQKTYRTTGRDWGGSIALSSDGGYVLAGGTDPLPFGGDDVEGHVVKLDASGNVQWQKTYGGALSDQLRDVQQTSDGGFVVAGWTRSFGAGREDAWVLKLDADGEIQWQKTFGGGNGDQATAVWQTADGGFIVAAGTSSFGTGHYDVWLLRLDAEGALVWQQTYGGTQADVALDVQQTSDGGFVVMAATGSFGATGLDPWILKLTAGGTVEWQRRYDTGAVDLQLEEVRQISDGGYIAAVGGTRPCAGCVPPSPGPREFLVLRLQPDGSISNSCPASLGASTDGAALPTSAVTQDSPAIIQQGSARALGTGVGITETDATVETLCSGPAVRSVRIDIKPGSDPNSINLKRQGTTPVAILSTADFDAVAQVDRSSLTFGRTGDEESLAFCTNSAEDVNGDGRLDLVCHFENGKTGFRDGDTEGILRGNTITGVPIEGRDAVRIIT